jgi:hypothetical protein
MTPPDAQAREQISGVGSQIHPKLLKDPIRDFGAALGYIGRRVTPKLLYLFR